jgi:hypothetical protein
MALVIIGRASDDAATTSRIARNPRIIRPRENRNTTRGQNRDSRYDNAGITPKIPNTKKGHMVE